MSLWCSWMKTLFNQQQRGRTGKRSLFDSALLNSLGRIWPDDATDLFPTLVVALVE